MIVQQKYHGFDVFVLTEEKSNSRAVLCPERGGILLQLSLKGQDVLYLQEDTFKDANKNIRGGNPILFPISGALPNNEYTIKGSVHSMKQHGFARNKVWSVEKVEPFKITLVLEDDEETRQQYPFHFRLKFTYELKDGKLSIHQVYENLSEDVMPFYAGFHPYFLSKHSECIYNIPASSFLDNSEGSIKSTTTATADLDIKDSIIYRQLSEPVASFKNDEYTFHLSYSDLFSVLVLWSERPEEYICLEPWMAEVGNFPNNEGVVELAPGQTIEAQCSFSID